MEKILKVCSIPQGSGYVPGVRVAGKYLNELNFSVDDVVIMTCKKDQIIIKKANPKDLVKRMAEQNPSLITLMETFELKA